MAKPVLELAGFAQWLKQLTKTKTRGGRVTFIRQGLDRLRILPCAVFGDACHFRPGPSFKCRAIRALAWREKDAHGATRLVLPRPLMAAIIVAPDRIRQLYDPREAAVVHLFGQLLEIPHPFVEIAQTVGVNALHCVPEQSQGDAVAMACLESQERLHQRFHGVLALVDRDERLARQNDVLERLAFSQDMRGERNNLGMLQRIAAEMVPLGCIGEGAYFSHAFQTLHLGGHLLLAVVMGVGARTALRMGCLDLGNLCLQVALQPASNIRRAPLDERSSETMGGLYLKHRIGLDPACDLICGGVGIGDDGNLAAVFAQGGQGLFVQSLKCLLERSRLARPRPGKEKEAARLIEGQALANRRVSARVAGSVGHICHAARPTPFSWPASQVRPVSIYGGARNALMSLMYSRSSAKAAFSGLFANLSKSALARSSGA